MASKEDASQTTAPSNSSWSSFLRSLASFNGDLSSMTAPPFILSSTSLTEFSSYWAEHPSLFVAPSEEKDPEKRMLAVVKWFLTTLKQQYSSRNEKLGSEKKPLNPFLGELFLGKWEDDSGTTHLVSEQVSHHPPVTAYCVTNEKHGVQLQGYNGQKASFSRRIDVKQIGHALLYLKKHDESYLITLPSLHIEGLITMSPYVELNGSTRIQSSTGYSAKIDYTGKGWLSGRKNSVVAHIYPEGKEKEIIYTLDGQWNTEFSIKDERTHQVIDKWSGTQAKPANLIVADIGKQDPLESRRAWHRVAEAMKKGDMNATSHEKSIIENWQRDLRKKEASEGKEWERIFFSDVEDWPTFDQLSAKIGEHVEAEKTNGVWRFDEEKWKTAKSPYRPGIDNPVE